MNLEIEHERKFLLKFLPDLAAIPHQHILQGYIRTEEGYEGRVRLIDGARAVLSFKERTGGVTREEVNGEISVSYAKALLKNVCGGFVEKTRYDFGLQPTIHIDLFHGRHTGLWLAEVELCSKNQNPALPPWIGEEVTGNRRFYSSFLAFSQQSESTISSNAQPSPTLPRPQTSREKIIDQEEVLGG